MKIAHVLRRLSFNDWGGTEQVVWNLAKAQKAAGHEVRIFATTALCETENETLEGMEIRRFKPLYPWWPMSRELVDALDRKGGNPFVPGLGHALSAWRPDVIHCHAMARIAELCLRTARKTGAKSIVSLHGGAANVPDAEARSLKAPTRRLLPWGKLVDCAMGWTRRIPDDADGIVCVGEDEYQRYRKRHPHVLFLPNGVDCGLFEGTGVAGKSRGCGVSMPVRLLCVARIDRQKNQMMLVEWLSRHADAVVRFVGPVTQPDYLAELERRAEELGVTDRLKMVGPLKPGSSELLAEYKDADVFVLPSRHEPFGIVILEAWAAGLPVVASNVGGMGRLCGAHPNAALTFVPGDAASMDAALERVVSDKTLREELRKEGLAAAKDYDWGKLAHKLVAFYGEK